jgi:6-phosphogluconolactonase
LEVFATPDDAARAAAEYIAQTAAAAVADDGRFTLAVSGGNTPRQMFAALARLDVPWAQTMIYQVDERIAPDGDPDRNLTHLRAELAGAPAQITPMPVNGTDVDDAAGRYAAALPARFDLVHLGIGPDGHTASLVPGDPVLDVRDRLVAVTAPYQNRRRMTLTYPALARAEQLLWLVEGADKRTPLAQLLAADSAIPAGRVEAAHSLVMADAAAAPA